MTKISEFFCNYCNPSNQRREEGDEVSTGYASELDSGFPLGWWEVPRKGPQGTTGHACPQCVLHNEAAKTDIQKRRGEDTARILGEEVDDGTEGSRLDSSPAATADGAEAGPAWPSITSPFEGQGGGRPGSEQRER